jgi:glycosyltransferase involved in cell wall biosynthesis
VCHICLQTGRVIEIKIAIIHYTSPEIEKGGVTTVIKNHATHLTKLGEDITVIYGKGGNLKGVTEKLIEELNPDHPDIVKLQRKILSREISEETRKQLINVKERLCQKIREAIKGKDIVIVHNIPSMVFNFPATLAINELAGESQSKFIFWIHDSVILRRNWRKFLRNWPFTELHFQHPNVTYVTITEYRAKQLAKIRDEQFRVKKVRVIHNGINLGEYVKLDETTLELKEKLKLKWEDYMILMPIRIVPRKNIELGLRIIYELKKLMGDRRVRLIITGPPDYQAMVRKERYPDYLNKMIKKLGLEDNVLLIHDLISFRRIRKKKKIRKWGIADIYALADLVLITSKEEGFGLPILEAGVARKPLFVGRIPPFEELLKEGIEAHMFGLNEKPSSIAFKIFRYFLTDIIQYNFNNVVEKYRWRTIVKEKVHPLLKELMGTK